MAVCFYNAGDKIDEVLSYSIPNGQDVHVIARWSLIAPKEEFFEAPTELEMRTTGESIAVQFAKDIERKFGERGVVRVEAGHDAEKEDPDQPMIARAASRTAAVVRGRELWTAYTRRVVDNHLQDCEAARASGGAPRTAQGFTKRCMKLHHISDPAEKYFLSLQEGNEPSAGNAQVAALQAQVSTMMAMMLATMQGKAIDPADLAKLAAPAIGATADGKPLTSGVCTGEVKKPIGESGYDAGQSAGKDVRAKNAAKHLG